jgi:hypothetical protein
MIVGGLAAPETFPAICEASAIGYFLMPQGKPEALDLLIASQWMHLQ